MPLLFGSMVKSSCSDAPAAVPVTLITRVFRVSENLADRHAVDQIRNLPAARLTRYSVVTEDLPDDKVPRHASARRISIRLRLTSPSFIRASGAVSLPSSAATRLPVPRISRRRSHLTEGFLHQLHVRHQLFQASSRRARISALPALAFYPPVDILMRWFPGHAKLQRLQAQVGDFSG